MFFKVVEIPEVDTPWKTGPEVQVLDNDNFDAKRWHKAPALYDLKPLEGLSTINMVSGII